MSSFDVVIGRALRTSTRLLSAAGRPAGDTRAAPSLLDHQLGLDASDLIGSSLSAPAKAHLLTAGPMYVAAQMESCGALEAVDALAGLYVTGTLQVSGGQVATTLTSLWHHRHERFTHQERLALVGRIFGATDGPQLLGQHAADPHDNQDFPVLFVDLVHAIATADPNVPSASMQVTQGVVNLVSNLAPRLQTLPEMVADDMLDLVKTAIVLFRDPLVQRALGALDTRSALTTAVSHYVGQREPVDAATACAAAGQVILAWAASVATASETTGLVPPQQVADAAAGWAAAMLHLVDASTTGT